MPLSSTPKPWRYLGYRDSNACRLVVMPGRRPLAPRLELWNHSPGGYGWGYAGSGPAQTSLAILAHFLRRSDSEDGGQANDAVAVQLHQLFKRRLIAALPAAWEMSARVVEEFIEMQLRVAFQVPADWVLWRASIVERCLLKDLDGQTVIRPQKRGKRD